MEYQSQSMAGAVYSVPVSDIINKSLETELEMKNKKYHTVETVPKSNRKFVERYKIDRTSTHIHDRSLSWLDIPSTHIHDRSLSWLNIPSTHIHDCSLSWLDIPSTHIHDRSLSWHFNKKGQG
jgi:hypothetical protein